MERAKAGAPRGSLTNIIDPSRMIQRDFELMKKQVEDCFELLAQVAANEQIK